MKYIKETEKLIFTVSFLWVRLAAQGSYRVIIELKSFRKFFDSFLIVFRNGKFAKIRLMISYSELIQTGIFIVSLIGLCYTVFKGKQK